MNKEQIKFIERVTNHWFIRQLFTTDVLEYVACQFALESNFGTSSLAQTQHNYCGMKVPRRRPFYGKSVDNLQFAYYDTFDNCVIDYCAWFLYTQPYSNTVYDLEAFKIHLLNSGYCPEKGYIDKINLIYQSLKNFYNGKEE